MKYCIKNVATIWFLGFIITLAFDANADIFDRIDACETANGSGCVFDLLRELAHQSGGAVPVECAGNNYKSMDGLCWRADDGLERTWDQSIQFCRGLGHGWRLPSMKDYLHAHSELWVHARIILNLVERYYWTATAEDTDRAWFTYYKREWDSLSPKNAMYHIICVR